MTKAGRHGSGRYYGKEIPAGDPPTDRWYRRPYEGADGMTRLGPPELIEKVNIARDIDLREKGFVPAEDPTAPKQPVAAKKE